jgi:oligo-1,6-glucosidase
MAFYRAGEEKKLLVLANFQKEARELPFTDKIVKVLMNSKDALNAENGKVCLEGYQAVILEVEQ